MHDQRSRERIAFESSADTDQRGGHIGLGVLMLISLSMFALLIYCGIRGIVG